MVHDLKVNIVEEDAAAEVTEVIEAVKVATVVAVDIVVIVAEEKGVLVGVAEADEVAVAVVMLHHSCLPLRRYSTTASIQLHRTYVEATLNA